MGSSERRKQRREAKRDSLLPINEIVQSASDMLAGKLDENTPAVLRLVRSEDGIVPAEPLPSGRPSETIAAVREPERSDGNGAEEAGADHVDTATDVSTDDASEQLVSRSYDATAINAIFNDPSVFPLVSIPGIETLDVSNLLADERNILLMAEGGGILFCWHEPCTYEVHTAFLEGFRGRHAIRASKAAYRWMFTRSDCLVLLTKVPAINPAAAAFCKIVGATLEFERKAIWPTNDGPVDMGYWSLRYDDWIRQTPAVKKSGKKFHDRLTEEFERNGRQEEQHPDEDCHDLHVGACVEMIYGGQLEKAVALYNGWAYFAGYGLINLVSRSPVVIDIGNALLQITDDTFKVILVR
jgi:hypothetical protein